MTSGTVTVEYRTKWTGFCKPKHARITRIIAFVPSGGVQIPGQTIMVQVPPGAVAGQTLQIQTPQGIQMATIPSGVSAGQTFTFTPVAPQVVQAQVVQAQVVEANVVAWGHGRNSAGDDEGISGDMTHVSKSTADHGPLGPRKWVMSPPPQKNLKKHDWRNFQSYQILRHSYVLSIKWYPERTWRDGVCALWPILALFLPCKRRAAKNSNYLTISIFAWQNSASNIQFSEVSSESLAFCGGWLW